MQLRNYEAVMVSVGKTPGILEEYGVEVHGNVASCYLEADWHHGAHHHRLDCHNGSREDVYVFTSHDGRAIERATLYLARKSGSICMSTAYRKIHEGQKVLKWPKVSPPGDDPATKGFIEVRFYKDEAPAQPADADAELSTLNPAALAASLDGDSSGWVPTPDEWDRPSAVFRFIYTGKPGYANLSEQAMATMARARTLEHVSRPPVVLPHVAARENGKQRRAARKGASNSFGEAHASSQHAEQTDGAPAQEDGGLFLEFVQLMQDRANTEHN
ncbi:uncharacterized protein B0H18DRAFT_1207931 [Fomitopsis serialis]|uniref:uncharacterized protein n=1 Tax=Fomitopsis serialis TaxID=139415 RepID=UPI00200797F8|nr:uncharacterized protein B0H18DRAFT_1207931 [Neoantrodia serialis]KAH9933773.1 hypothetical protein B0H18DRAFT_1207931 [Neoantrodia serialis]